MAIAQLVLKHGPISVEQLVERIGVSMMTIYRDLAALEEAGLLHRERGRVSALATGLHEASASFRVEQQSEMKQSIAQHLVKSISSRSSLLVDDSTSGVFVVRELRDKTPLTVISNSLLVANEAAQIPGLNLFLLGGSYQEWASATIGSTTVAQLATLDVDYCIISASGLANGRCFHPYEDVVAVKRAMLAAADKRFLVLDHSKMTRRALHAFAALDEFDLVVVDHQTTSEAVARLREWGAKVEVAPPPQ